MTARSFARGGTFGAIALLATLATQILAGATPGPVALAIDESRDALILRADGRLFAFDLTSGKKGDDVFRVPPDFAASDIAVAGAVKYLILNSKRTEKYASFVLQILPNNRQVWTMLPRRGVYIGIAVDAAGKYAYATNSTTNSVFRVELGNEKARATELTSIADAEVLGGLAIDEAARRLFVADITGGRVFVVDLARPANVRRVEIPAASELRAVAWQPAGRRLFVADVGQESVFAIDPERPSDIYQVTHRAFREPSGLALAPDGSMWGVDQGSRSIFQILANQKTPARVVSLD